MKRPSLKISLLLVAMSLISVSSFAQKLPINEGFEGFKLTTSSNSGLVSFSGLQWIRSGDDITLQVVENPSKTGINKSDKVLKLTRAENNSITATSANGFTWRGVTSVSYDLSNGNKSTIEFKVLKNVAGKLAIRLFSDENKHYVELVSNELPASADWQTVKFDFSGRIEQPITKEGYIVIQLEKNSNTLASQEASMMVYFDDIKMLENK